ncbi:hypothetical protein [Sulfuricystis multivorans]|uniref:hypothetical protein n=1 Tax=Sulfuricystis multivorans TaxID=2211108 RepID=UPI000F846ED1|nr:hypothetical protein [Sulfuricystis multivorans]
MSLVVRFSDQVSKFETTHQRLKDIAEFLGVSQNKAVAFAINQAWEYLAEHEDMREELEFKRHGVKVGGVTYLNHDPAFIERVRERIAKGVPLPHEDDDGLDGGLTFLFLTEEQQRQVRDTTDPAEKRRLKAKFLRDNEKLSPEEWETQVAIAKHSPD